MFNLPQPVGLLVQRVAQNSPAAIIGLRGGTMKATIDGRTFTVGGDILLEVQLGRLHPGAQLTITILRDGSRVELLGRLP